MNVDPNTRYSGARQGQGVSIALLNVDEQGNAIEPGHRCTIATDSDSVAVDKVLLLNALAFMDQQTRKPQPD